MTRDPRLPPAMQPLLTVRGNLSLSGRWELRQYKNDGANEDLTLERRNSAIVPGPLLREDPTILVDPPVEDGTKAKDPAVEEDQSTDQSEAENGGERDGMDEEVDDDADLDGSDTGEAQIGATEPQTAGRKPSWYYVEVLKADPKKDTGGVDKDNVIPPLPDGRRPPRGGGQRANQSLSVPPGRNSIRDLSSEQAVRVKEEMLASHNRDQSADPAEQDDVASGRGTKKATDRKRKNQVMGTVEEEVEDEADLVESATTERKKTAKAGAARRGRPSKKAKSTREEGDVTEDGEAIAPHEKKSSAKPKARVRNSKVEKIEEDQEQHLLPGEDGQDEQEDLNQEPEEESDDEMSDEIQVAKSKPKKQNK